MWLYRNRTRQSSAKGEGSQHLAQYKGGCSSLSDPKHIARILVNVQCQQL